MAKKYKVNGRVRFINAMMERMICYFDAQPDSSLEAIEAEADQHPVFLLEAI